MPILIICWKEHEDRSAPSIQHEHGLSCISATTAAEVSSFWARLPKRHKKQTTAWWKCARQLHLCSSWLCAQQENRVTRQIQTTYFITSTYSINQLLEALNVCDSITNQQIDTTLLWCRCLVFSIMQQHLSAKAQPTVYLLSGAVTTAILHMNLSALLCHNSSSNFHWWSVKQSVKATKGIRVSYRSGTDPTCMLAHTNQRACERMDPGAFVLLHVCACCERHSSRL